MSSSNNTQTPNISSTKYSNSQCTFLHWMDESAIAELIGRIKSRNNTYSLLADHINSALEARKSVYRVYTEIIDSAPHITDISLNAVTQKPNKSVTFYVRIIDTKRKNVKYSDILKSKETAHISIHISECDFTQRHGIFHIQGPKIRPPVQLLVNISNTTLENTPNKRKEMKINYNTTNPIYNKIQADFRIIRNILNRYFNPSDSLYIKKDISTEKYINGPVLQSITTIRQLTQRPVPKSNTRKKHYNSQRNTRRRYRS